MCHAGVTNLKKRYYHIPIRVAKNLTILIAGEDVKQQLSYVKAENEK